MKKNWQFSLFNRSVVIFFFIFTLNHLRYAHSSENAAFPVLYESRFRPAESYGRLWLHNHYHHSSIRKADLNSFHVQSSSALSFLWQLNVKGSKFYENTPLFWIQSAKLKEFAKLPLKSSRFSLAELGAADKIIKQSPILQDDPIYTDWLSIKHLMNQFEQIKGLSSDNESAYIQRYAQLKTQAVQSHEIAKRLELEFPVLERLKNAGSLFKILPGRAPDKNWYPINALLVKVYNPSTEAFDLVGNFTAYSPANFEMIRNRYQVFTDFVLRNDPLIQEIEQHLTQALAAAYLPLSAAVYEKFSGKQIDYPSVGQLNIENFYLNWPWIPLLICLYIISICLLILSLIKSNTARFFHWGFYSFVVAFILHTFILGMRCYILQRPPVSNMFETVIYVPWVACFAVLLFKNFRSESAALLAGASASLILLIILEATHLNEQLNPVQAVLDSQFWLLIHVLMVVGSYGLFILGALIAHVYLLLSLSKMKLQPYLPKIGKLVLQSLYGGTLLLITGTILGGVWAAESWGRFWDWDPKESWAFISSCFYLVTIHAFRFGKMGYFGLSIGAIFGLLAISFTWYGVNYLLGTGLHSYGFGSGGEIYYYAFLLFEISFISYVINKMIRQTSKLEI